MIKRTISVDMIITLLQQMILCDYITDVSRNLAFIIFIAQIICFIVVLKVLTQMKVTIVHNYGHIALPEKS